MSNLTNRIYILGNINQENRPEVPSQNLMICFGSRTLQDEGPSFLLVKGSANDFPPNCIPWEKLKTNVDQQTSSSTTQSERGKFRPNLFVEMTSFVFMMCLCFLSTQPNDTNDANARTCFSGKRSVNCMERCMEHSSLHPAQCNLLC